MSKSKSELVHIGGAVPRDVYELLKSRFEKEKKKNPFLKKRDVLIAAIKYFCLDDKE